MSTHHLAQLNVGRLRAAADSPVVAEFMAALDPINALAEASPGFVWRFQTDEGNATAVKAFDDDLLILNMSVWESVEALADYVYRSDHTSFLRRRREWFEKTDIPPVTMWWVPAGHVPTVAEALARMEHLQANGPSPFAFSFRQPYAAPDADGAAQAQPADDRDACPA